MTTDGDLRPLSTPLLPPHQPLCALSPRRHGWGSVHPGSPHMLEKGCSSPFRASCPVPPPPRHPRHLHPQELSADSSLPQPLSTPHPSRPLLLLLPRPPAQDAGAAAGTARCPQATRASPAAASSRGFPVARQMGVVQHPVQGRATTRAGEAKLAEGGPEGGRGTCRSAGCASRGCVL